MDVYKLRNGLSWSKRELHEQAFTAPGAPHSRTGPEPITNYGMELSRGFKTLKVWMSLKEHRIDHIQAK